MAWIESHDDIWEHHKTVKLCKMLNLEDVTAVGHLVSLWHFTLRNAWRDSNLEPWGDDGIERACRWKGQAGVFVAALRDCGFLDGAKVHGFMERAGRLVSDRRKNEIRKQEKCPPYVKRKKNVRRTYDERTKFLENRRLPYPTLPNPTQPNLTIPKTKSVFTKPTPQEVTEYSKSIGFDLDGHSFFDHYESKGWKIGSTPMKNWQAAVRTWKKRGHYDFRNGSSVRSGVSVEAAPGKYAALTENS